MNQYSSSYHFLAASLSLKPNNADILSTLASLIQFLPFILLYHLFSCSHSNERSSKCKESLQKGNGSYGESRYWSELEREKIEEERLLQKMWNYAVFEFNEGELESSKEAVEKLLERLKTPSNNEEEVRDNYEIRKE